MPDINFDIQGILRGYNNRMLRYAHFVDGVIRFSLGSRPRPERASAVTEPRKILVVQSHLIGDVIMSTPMLRALRRTYPGSEITLLANGFAGDLLAGFPHVDRIITMRFPWATYDYGPGNLLSVAKTLKALRDERFDLAIDAQIDMRNAFLLYLIGAKRRLGYGITGGEAFLTDSPEMPAGVSNLLDARLSLLGHIGVNPDDRGTELPVGAESLEWAEGLFSENGLDPAKTVGIHPGASVMEKRWSPAKFAVVIDFLAASGYRPMLIEGPGDGLTADEITSIYGEPLARVRTTLKNIVAFISKCRLIVCLDSAAVHIAGATGTPAVAVYGPKWPALTLPHAANIEAVWDETFDCRPCEYGRCKSRGRSCMDAVSADSVIAKAKRLLSEPDSHEQLKKT